MVRIREARESLNMSQEQFAEMLGYSQRSISNWESGIREPKYSILIQIADICGMTTDYLLGRTDLKTFGEPISSEEKNRQLNAAEYFLNEEHAPLLLEEPKVDGLLQTVSPEFLQSISDFVRQVVSEQLSESRKPE